VTNRYSERESDDPEADGSDSQNDDGAGESSGNPTDPFDNNTPPGPTRPTRTDDLDRTIPIYHPPPTKYPILISPPLRGLEQSFSEGISGLFGVGYVRVDSDVVLVHEGSERQVNHE
jgi:hypothetical protein